MKGRPGLTSFVSAMRLASAFGGIPKNWASELCVQNNSHSRLKAREGSFNWSNTHAPCLWTRQKSNLDGRLLEAEASVPLGCLMHLSCNKAGFA